MRDEELRAAIREVLTAFEAGLFIRAMDAPIMKFVRPIHGLAVLTRFVEGDVETTR